MEVDAGFEVEVDDAPFEGGGSALARPLLVFLVLSSLAQKSSYELGSSTSFKSALIVEGGREAAELATCRRVPVEGGGSTVSMALRLPRATREGGTGADAVGTAAGSTGFVGGCCRIPAASSSSTWSFGWAVSAILTTDWGTSVD